MGKLTSHPRALTHFGTIRAHPRPWSLTLWKSATIFRVSLDVCKMVLFPTAVWYILIAEHDDKSWIFLGSQFWVNPRWFKMTWNVWASGSFPPFPLLWQRFSRQAVKPFCWLFQLSRFFFFVSVPPFVYFGLSWFVCSFFRRKNPTVHHEMWVSLPFSHTHIILSH